MQNTAKSLVGVVIMLFWLTTSSAQPIENFAIHGFRGWPYGKTDNENRYLSGNNDSNYEYLNFSFNIAAKPYKQISLHIQSGFNESSEGSEVGLDYAFAEWSFSDVGWEILHDSVWGRTQFVAQLLLRL